MNVEIRERTQEAKVMGYVDIHSHILPGMDDGSRSIEQTLRMLEIAVSQGISVMIATPHNMPGKGCPSERTVRERTAELQKIIKKEGIPIQLFVGTEYYYREEVPELLEDGRGIPLANSECVLVEFEPFAERNYIRNALRDIWSLGYRPVLAHVERYVRLMEKISVLDELRKMGVLMQVNAASVIGDNGWQTKNDVKNMLKNQLVDFVATDAHSDGRRAPYMEKCASVLYRKYGEEYADALLFGNAERYLLESGAQGV